MFRLPGAVAHVPAGLAMRRWAGRMECVAVAVGGPKSSSSRVSPVRSELTLLVV